MKFLLYDNKGNHKKVVANLPIDVLKMNHIDENDHNHSIGVPETDIIIQPRYAPYYDKGTIKTILCQEARISKMVLEEFPKIKYIFFSGYYGHDNVEFKTPYEKMREMGDEFMKQKVINLYLKGVLIDYHLEENDEKGNGTLFFRNNNSILNYGKIPERLMTTFNKPPTDDIDAEIRKALVSAFSLPRFQSLDKPGKYIYPIVNLTTDEEIY